MNCDIIQDLLPLYHDGVCSAASQAAVKEHLASCKTCREALSALDAPLPEKQKAAADDAAAVRKISKEWARSKWRARLRGAAVAAVLCGFLTGGWQLLANVNWLPVDNGDIEITDLSQKDGGLPPDSVVQTVDEIMKDSARIIEAYHDPRPGSMRQVALAPCSPFSVSAELLRQSAILARQYGVRLHTHLCETKDEERYMRTHHGVRPLEFMASLGWTGPDVWYAHGIHFNDEELRELARTGTGIAHCPISNMKLSSGIARIPEMLALGVPVGLAVDGSASNDGSSLMEELRVAYLLHRLNSSKAAPSGYQVLKMATRGSARLLGRDDIGQLAVGKCADFFLVDSRRLELVGGEYSPADVLATVGLRGPVDYTVVNGKIVVKEGRLTAIDEEKTAEEARQCCRDYLAMS